MGGIGYGQFAAVVRGRLTGEEALRLMIRDTVRYAKRQMTWFARDPEIRWIDLDAGGGVEGAAESILKLITRGGWIEGEPPRGPPSPGCASPPPAGPSAGTP